MTPVVVVIPFIKGKEERERENPSFFSLFDTAVLQCTIHAVPVCRIVCVCVYDMQMDHTICELLRIKGKDREMGCGGKGRGEEFNGAREKAPQS